MSDALVQIDQLKAVARRIRREIAEISIVTGGHIASSYSCLEILLALYQAGVMRVRPHQPDWPQRDRFILSKGHAETALYVVLADLGFFPCEWLSAYYRAGDHRLGGHPDRSIPGVEMTTGALGHGLGVAAGLALAARMDGQPQRHYVLMGDAECAEGSIWEAGMFAAQHQLGNLIGIVDRNRIGASDFTDNFIGLGSLVDKWRAFGWETEVCDGHDFAALIRRLRYAAQRETTTPFMLIAETVKGKGVSFMENDPMWHVKRLADADEIRQAREELADGGDDE
ncbi:MAG: transketolase [Desulfuromonadaceae bacterium]|nr:transketolase [Desulfuromonadaceae bacterium]